MIEGRHANGTKLHELGASRFIAGANKWPMLFFYAAEVLR